MSQEIVSIQQADQFQPGHSAYECGFFAVSMLTSVAPAGQTPRKTPQQIVDQAEQWYADYNGNNLASNQLGMTLRQLYDLLKQEKLNYQPITSLSLADIRGWLAKGCPVVVAGTETGFHDLAMGDIVPYPWTPTGTHVIVLTGTDGNNFLVRDSANIAPPNTLRSGPRLYDGSKMQLVSATAIIPSWVNTAPAPSNGEHTPSGWKDNGKVLVAPNGISVVDGFRLYVLTHDWDAANIPLEPEHANADGLPGTQQTFLYSMLLWESTHGVTLAQVGSIILALRKAAADAKSQLVAAPTVVMPAVPAPSSGGGNGPTAAPASPSTPAQQTLPSNIHAMLVQLSNATQVFADLNSQALAILKEVK